MSDQPIQKQAAVAKTADGQAIDAYTLCAGAMRLRVLTLGGIVTHLFVPGRAGTAPADVVLGFDDDSQYVSTPHPYFGALIGRFGNRIARGRFTLDGVEHRLATNNGPNHLHGGKVGYDKRVWSAEPIDGASPALRLTLIDADGTEGYPGTVKVTVTYALTPDAWRIEYEATSDRATPINLTNHTYFNLHDAGASPIVEHLAKLEADEYLPVDATLIPTGEPAAAKGTPIDFAREKPIGRDLAAMGGNPAGYDHCVVLRRRGDELALAATVTDPASRRRMECWTTEPAVQFYSGNFLDGTLAGKGGAVYQRHHGFCLETQHYPDSPNRAGFPGAVLRPGETLRARTEYRFGA